MSFVEKESKMKINRQCKLLGVPRSSYYHKPKRKVSLLDEMLMQAIDRIYMEEPTYGSRRIRDELKKLGYDVGRKRVRSLMQVMGIDPIYPKPRLSIPGKGHKKYPYLLRNLRIERSNQGWCTDITYIPLGDGHVYLTAVMDWSSRYVINWKLSNSMDGKGRALDNVMIERLWRTVKYDDIYIRGYETMNDLYQGLSAFFRKYNTRKHQGLGMSPEQKYRSGFIVENAA